MDVLTSADGLPDRHFLDPFRDVSAPTHRWAARKTSFSENLVLSNQLVATLFRVKIRVFRGTLLGFRVRFREERPSQRRHESMGGIAGPRHGCVEAFLD